MTDPTNYKAVEVNRKWKEFVSNKKRTLRWNGMSKAWRERDDQKNHRMNITR